jgi:DNA-binding beta-propeller fold protein YncE
VRNVLEFDGSTGAFVRVFVDDTGNGAGAIDPYGLAFHGGRFFVGSFFFDHVMEFDATTGAFVQTLVAPGSGGLSGPRGLAFGPAGDLYVTSDGDDTVKRYDGATGSFLGSFVASGSGGLDGPVDLGFGAGTPSPPAVPALAPAAQAFCCAALAALGWRRLSRPPGARRRRGEP